jgi:NAD(P)-dependent dehydrogenase (short-subunit alcohol dehydrogenase family)
MSGKLTGKIAVVTGGSAGIGRGAAKRFAQQGARMFITGRDRAGCQRRAAGSAGHAGRHGQGGGVPGIRCWPRLLAAAQDPGGDATLCGRTQALITT